MYINGANLDTTIATIGQNCDENWGNWGNGALIVFKKWVTILGYEGAVRLKGCDFRGGVRIRGDTSLNRCRLYFPEKNCEVIKRTRTDHPPIVEIRNCEIDCYVGDFLATEMSKCIITATYLNFGTRSSVRDCIVTVKHPTLGLTLKDESEFGKNCVLRIPYDNGKPVINTETTDCRIVYESLRFVDTKSL